MVLELKLRQDGDDVSVVLPEAALARLNAGAGDAVYLTDAPDGGLRLTVAKPDFAQKMAIAESLSHRYHDALRELAK